MFTGNSYPKQNQNGLVQSGGAKSREHNFKIRFVFFWSSYRNHLEILGLRSHAAEPPLNFFLWENRLRSELRAPFQPRPHRARTLLSDRALPLLRHVTRRAPLKTCDTGCPEMRQGPRSALVWAGPDLGDEKNGCGRCRRNTMPRLMWCPHTCRSHNQKASESRRTISSKNICGNSGSGQKGSSS